MFSDFLEDIMGGMVEFVSRILSRVTGFWRFAIAEFRVLGNDGKFSLAVSCPHLPVTYRDLVLALSGEFRLGVWCRRPLARCVFGFLPGCEYGPDFILFPPFSLTENGKLT